MKPPAREFHSDMPTQSPVTNALSVVIITKVFGSLLETHMINDMPSMMDPIRVPVMTFFSNAMVLEIPSVTAMIMAPKILTIITLQQLIVIALLVLRIWRCSKSSTSIFVFEKIMDPLEALDLLRGDAFLFGEEMVVGDMQGMEEVRAPTAAASGGGGDDNPAPTKKKKRLLSWNPDTTYTLVRPGIPITRDQLESDDNQHHHTEAHLFIFKHKDHQNIKRNALVPLYEAVYEIGPGIYIRAQKCHLEKAYTKCGRKDKKRADEILPDGTPYWVDRFGHRK